MADLAPRAVGFGMSHPGDVALTSYLAKCQLDMPVIPEAIMAFVHDVAALIWPRLPFSRVDAIRGMTHEEALAEMKPHTACGFPFKESSKGEALTALMQYKLFHNFRNVLTSPHYTTVAYKVEALSDATIERKHCRILRYVNLDFLYKQLRLYGHMMHAHNDNADWPRDMCLGGFNDFEGGWEKLHSAFDGKNCYGSDGKYYDTAFTPFDYAFIDIIMRKAMGYVEPDVHNYIMKNSAHSVGLIRTGELWRFNWTHSTGHLMTKVWNDLKTCACFGLTYLMEYRKRQLDPQREFELFSHSVRTAICGDDNLFSSTFEWFTGPLLRETCLLVGTTFELEFEEPRSSDCLGFLSAGTTRCPVSGYRMPLRQGGKTVARLIHAKHDERNVGMRWQRAYGCLLALWPNAEYREALQNKLNQLRVHLPPDSTSLGDRYDNRYLRWLYTGLEGP